MRPSPLSIPRTFPSSQTETLNPLNTDSPFLSHPVPDNHHSTSCLYEFDYARYHLSVESDICPSVSGLLHLASCSQGSSMFEHVSKFHSLR